MGTSNTVVTGRSATSPSNNKMGTKVEVPLLDTIPVIFIPGIMGSNIKHKEFGKVWDMPNGKVAGMKTASKRSQLTPAELQRQLDPEKTFVDDSGTIKVDKRLKLDEKTLRKRYWGTVHWDSYGDILTYLQLVLNNVSAEQPNFYPTSAMSGDVINQLKQHEATVEWMSLLREYIFKHWSPQEKFLATNKQEIEHLKNFNFPVYAMGYNWLQSNEDSADIILKKLKAIKAEYGTRFHKFIIVSHSMGGLVTRRLAQLCGDDIAGVVHGVMPADGAAAAYRRIVSGSYEGGGLVPWITSFVLGPNTEHVTAVLANSPGGLELLPNAEYNDGQPWLTLQGRNEKNELVEVQLPSKDAEGVVDPYEQIYKADKVWWEMVKAELIDPANMTRKADSKKQPKDIYKDRIEKVKSFHSNIVNKYHPHTYVSYGHDSKFKSFSTLTWTLDQKLQGLNKRQLQTLRSSTENEKAAHRQKIVQEQMKKIKEGNGRDVQVNTKEVAMENNGVRYITLSSGNIGVFSISSQDGDGDGTVPWQSGRAPFKKPGVKQVFQMTGFDHQESYKNSNVKRSTLYSIVKIIKDNNIKPKFR